MLPLFGEKFEIRNVCLKGKENEGRASAGQCSARQSSVRGCVVYKSSAGRSRRVVEGKSINENRRKRVSGLKLRGLFYE